MNDVMSFINFADFAGGKNLVKNFYAKSFHVVIVPDGSASNHPFALSFNENGNSLNLMASSDTPFDLKVSQISKKLAMCRFGSFFKSPLN